MLADSPLKVLITCLNILMITKMSTKNLISAVSQIISNNIIVEKSVYSDYLIFNILAVLIRWAYSRIWEYMAKYETLFSNKYSKKD